MPLAFIGGIELVWVLILGLLLFGGRLPDVAKDMGRMFFKAKRSLDEIRRDSGIDEAIRDLERETKDLDRKARDFASEAKSAASTVPDWRQNLDPSVGPDKIEASAETEALESGGGLPENEATEALAEPDLADPELSEPSEEAKRRLDSQQSDPESPSEG
jgi:Sec-independent protein translocase protein TatA